MTGVGTVIERLHNPEYTGENRCIPCTIVNALLTALMAASVWAVASAAGSGSIATGAALLALLFGAGSIYLRGYLVPGTPELTKRYLPPWLLELFGKSPYETDVDRADPDIDVEATLVDVDALEECEDVDDLCLTDQFRADWHERIDVVEDEDARRERLLSLLDLSEGEVSYEEYDDAFRVVAKGQFVGRWESRAAFLADVAAGELLEDRIDEWDVLGVGERGAILNGLRLFLTTCPTCGGPVSFGTETVESCCTSHDVAAVTCNDCDARLFESEPISA